VYPGKKAAHFAAEDKPILAIAVSFFVVSRSRASKRKQARIKQETKPMNIISLIIQLISGAVGGNIAGAAMKESSLGTLGNSIAGIVGGGLGGAILQAVLGSAAAGGGGLDLSTILSNVVGGGVGGAILMAIVGIIKNKMAAK
jgi:uncharacterized membrane protein YeaQ/YmgE (transglycosylase-associated protein family)